MPVPLLDLRRQHAPLEAEFKAAFERVLHSGHFILGPELAAFEKDLAQFLGVPHALGVSSGTDAILLALMALEIGPGDEVLVPDFTFFATAGCVARLGATPVFVDVCPACFNLDVADAAQKITPRTKAIIPVHLYGQSADMDSVLALARTHQLAIIEDAAQSLGAKYKGRQVGTMGTFGAYSFFPTKNLGALGDAGLLCASDPALAERAAVLRVHGMKPKYHHPFIGGNFRLDALQAALMRVKLPHYATYCRARQANAAWYNETLARLPGVAVTRPQDCQHSSEGRDASPRRPHEAKENSPNRPHDDKNASASSAASSPSTPASFPASTNKITLPAALPHNEHIWNQYTLRVHGPGRRDALLAHLQKSGIGAEIYYPVPLGQQPCFKTIGCGGENCVNSRTLATEVLSFPIFPELTPLERAEVAAAIASFLRAG